MRRVTVAVFLAAGLPMALLLARCASGRDPARTVGTGRPAAAAGTPAASPAPTAAPAATPAPGGAAPAPGDAAPAPPVPPAATPSPAARIDFASRIVPLLQERCSPCHFPGGRMYARLPFDQEATIRVKNGTSDSQDVTFLEQDPKSAP